MLFLQTWKDYLLDIFSNNYKWNIICQKDYLDKYLLEEVILTFKNLLPLCKETRKLLHKDFGSNNILVSNLKITGIIEWNLASYGDPLI